MASPARDLRYIAGMTHADIFALSFAAIICGNMLTVAFFYGVWRLHRNEQDKPALFIVLFCLFFMGAAGFALHEMSQEQTTDQAHSESR